MLACPVRARCMWHFPLVPYASFTYIRREGNMKLKKLHTYGEFKKNISCVCFRYQYIFTLYMWTREFILHFQSKVPKLIYAVESNIWNWKWRNGARLAILQARNKGERKLGSPNEAIVIFNWVSIFIHVVCRIWHNIMV